MTVVKLTRLTPLPQTFPLIYHTPLMWLVRLVVLLQGGFRRQHDLLPLSQHHYELPLRNL